MTSGTLAQAQTYPTTDEFSQTLGGQVEKKAVESIRSSSQIAANAQVDFTAGQSIQLTPGFDVRPGAVFSATIARVANKPTGDNRLLSLSVYPNPFRDVASIDYFLPVDSRVRLNLVNVQGQEIRELVNANQKAGDYMLQYDGRLLSAGAYLYILATATERKTFKVIKE